ncbi:uncharacterized protein LOC122959321 [Acropora millepora]|uniref:uncharacterized protein LOC122959321 n=1 Tax=Acropora millepora TaxID=45264 RepID=UPI001CF23975|nr:uncharacterized protein LOC122959321 [Acropora millepora]
MPNQLRMGRSMPLLYLLWIGTVLGLCSWILHLSKPNTGVTCTKKFEDTFTARPKSRDFSGGRMENASINESGAKLHLVTQFPVFNPSLGLGEKGAKERQEEVIFCLQRNLLSPHIHTIHILCEEAHDVLFVKALNLSMDWKLVFQILGRRMTYKDAFQYASRNLLGKNTIIMNSDNYVHEGFEHLDENILADKTMYALTRREIAEEGRKCNYEDYCAVNYTYRGSHDAWVFRLMAPIASDILDKINYPQNYMGIEQVLIFYFKTSEGFTVKNPCRILKIVHHHCSDTRVKKDRYINGRRIDVILGIRSDKTPGELCHAPFSGL